MLSARQLHKQGLKVALLEKGELGQESSWAGGGILSPLHPWRYSDKVNELANTGHQCYQQLATELLDEGGVDPEYIRNGLLVLDSNEQVQAAKWADQWDRRLQSAGSAETLQEICPGVSAHYTEGLWLPDVAQMRNPRLVKSARASLDALGVEYQENMPVERLLIKHGCIQGVVAGGKERYADKVLIAGGAWSAEIMKELADVPEIEPVKGQMILFKGAPATLSRILLADNRYLIPRKDGRILCGSTLEHTGFVKDTSEIVRTELLASAVEIFPQLADMQIEHHWAGLRPGSPNGDPYIGEHAEVRGLYVNAGHYRNGVILAIGSVQRIAEIITA